MLCYGRIRFGASCRARGAIKALLKALFTALFKAPFKVLLRMY